MSVFSTLITQSGRMHSGFKRIFGEYIHGEQNHFDSQSTRTVLLLI